MRKAIAYIFVVVLLTSASGTSLVAAPARTTEQATERTICERDYGQRLQKLLRRIFTLVPNDELPTPPRP